MKLEKTALVCAIFYSIVSAAHAELAWEKTELELHPQLGAPTAIANFKYENKGDKPVHINAVRTSCGCTVATLKKNDVAPGEKGEITATLSIGDRTGTQVKTVTVETDDLKQPSTVLTLKAVIAQGLELRPAFVYWESGEAPNPKMIVATAGKDMTVKNLNAVSSNPNFTTKVSPGSKAGEFRIEVKPLNTGAASAGTIEIKTDPPNSQGKPYYGRAQVTAPSVHPTNS